MTVIYCKRCLFPDTKPDLYFDDEGVCDACRSAERKHGIENSIDWDERRQDFEKILADVKAKKRGKYDCIVPVSGGKDSTWQVYAMAKIHKLKVLAITFDQFDQTPTGEYNIKVLQDIGVDHIHFTLNPNIVRKLVKKGLELIGDPYWVNHVGIFTIPFYFANTLSVPLIVYGENPQFEYGGPTMSRDNMVMDRRWRQEFGGMRGLREEDMVDDVISSEDMDALKFPKASDQEVLGVFYGYFFKWDATEHLEVVKSLGWKALPKAPEGSWLDYENCDMKFIDIRERIKYLKYGYGRATDQLNISIRRSSIGRAEALEIARDVDGKVDPESLKEFSEYIEMTEPELVSLIDSFVNEEIFHKVDGEWIEKSVRV